MQEITGKVLGNTEYSYHTPLYKDLLKAVVPLRKSYRLERDISARKDIATTEYSAWR